MTRWLPALSAIAAALVVYFWLKFAVRGSGLDGYPLRDRVGYWRHLWDSKQWWFLREIPPEYQTCIFTGLPGHGKTTFGTDLMVRYLRQGVVVYSNIQLKDTFTGRSARPVRNWLDVMRASIEALENGWVAVIYLAEINTLCDARSWQETPRWWLEMMQERRHMGLGIMGDTQTLSQLEKRLRLLVGRVVQVRPSWLRHHWRRWPVFIADEVDILTSDDPALWLPEGKRRRYWMYSHAFHGHSTWEMVPNQSFDELDTPEARAEIDALRARAVELNKRGVIQTYDFDEKFTDQEGEQDEAA